MSDNRNFLDQFMNRINTRIKKESIWREEPVDLITFFKSKDFLGETPYPGKQTEVLEITGKLLMYKFTGDEQYAPKELHNITELTILAGKGSGKDFLVSGILAYACYLLCNLNDPQSHFGFGKMENIDLINVAENSNQANSVFFKKLAARLKSCKWFNRVKMEPQCYNDFQLTKNQIRFYNTITAHSTHSEADAFEGFNPLLVIFDEIGGFDPDNAEDCYKTFRSSALTRYLDKMLLIFISFPRHKSDFISKKYEESKTVGGSYIYSIRGSTWEFNPTKPKKMFDKEYERDPEGSALKYETIAPEYVSSFYTYPHKIDECVVVGKQSSSTNLFIETKTIERRSNTGIVRKFTGLELHNLVLDPRYTYYLGGDAAIKNDSYVIALYHAVPTTMERVENGELIYEVVNKPVEDLILEWKPNKKDKLVVDTLNVAGVLELICSKVYVKKALFDTFNSADIIQRLLSLGVDAEDKAFSNPFQVKIHTNLRAHIYTGNIELLDYQSENEVLAQPNEELKFLQLENGNKITHDESVSGKDFSDARAAAVWVCSTDEPDIIEHFAPPMIMGTRRK